jgi:hypothetical protein
MTCHGAPCGFSRAAPVAAPLSGLAAMALCLWFAMLGCRAHPISLAITLVGDAVDDRDNQQRKPKLVGRPMSAADEMFGRRHDTLVDVNIGLKWLIYPEPGESFAESFYVAEASREGTITGLFKCKRNIDGLEDVEKTKLLGGKVYGKPPSEAQAAGRLGDPLQIMRSEVTGAVARFYDARNWTHTRGARYCVLVFGPRDLCEEVRFVGVTAR